MIQVLLIAGLLLILGVLLLILFLIRLVRRLTFHVQEGKPFRPPPSVSYWAIFLAMIVLVISWVFFWSANQLKSFEPYKPSAAAGVLEVSRKGDSVKSMKFDYYHDQVENLKTATSFYLSGNTWRIKVQFVKFSGVLSHVFGWSYYYKVSDFYSDYSGHKPPGIKSPMLSHEEIEGGSVDLDSYVSFFGFLENAVEVNEFESEFVKISRHAKYWLVLTDSNEVRLETTAPSMK